MVTVRSYSDILFVFVDSIALLDMLCSFAELVNHHPTIYSKPIITDTGPLVINEGRHLILLSSLDSFQIITGVNSSGKSTYIKQVALITILAQIGCFVPARHATIPLRDRILRWNI